MDQVIIHHIHTGILNFYVLHAIEWEYSQLQPVCSIISSLQITSLLIQPHEMAKADKNALSIVWAQLQRSTWSSFTQIGSSPAQWVIFSPISRSDQLDPNFSLAQSTWSPHEFNTIEKILIQEPCMQTFPFLGTIHESLSSWDDVRTRAHAIYS
jgi:hypothetical protein